MQEEKQKFIYGDEALGIPGCIRNGISEGIAITIYDQMIDFAKYAFNKSHAAAYAAISMQTAYLKAHYRLEFIAGLLTSATEKTPKLAKYIAECKSSGIKVLPPDINYSGKEFIIEDGSIRFSLLAIKKVGGDVVDHIIEERKNGKYTSLTDFIERNPIVNSGALENMAYTGCFESLGYNRRTVISNYVAIAKGVKNSTKGQVEGQLSIFDLADQSVAKETLTIVSEFDQKDILCHEKESLGLYLTGHPLERYQYKVSSRITKTADDFVLDTNEDGQPVQKLEDGKPVVVAGMITKVKKIFTKKSGEPMAFVVIEDMVGQISCVIFPKLYKECQGMLEEDRVVLIQGKVSVKDDEYSILADAVTPAESLSSTLWIKFDNKDEYRSRKEKLEAVYANAPGDDNVAIYFADTRQVVKRQHIVDGHVLLSEFQDYFTSGKLICK